MALVFQGVQHRILPVTYYLSPAAQFVQQEMLGVMEARIFYMQTAIFLDLCNQDPKAFNTVHIKAVCTSQVCFCPVYILGFCY